MSETAADQPKAQRMPEVRKRGIFAEIIGQFTTRDFWIGLAKALVQEAFTSMLVAFGGTLVWYGKQRRSKEIAVETGSIGGGEASSRAFGGSYAPNTSYSPSFSAPPSHGDGRFPGFGR